MSKNRKNSQSSFLRQEAKDIEKKATKLGHKLGKWKKCDGLWRSKCQHKGCIAEATINREGHSQLTNHKRRCTVGVNPA